MYRLLIRPVLFLFPPETIHRILVVTLKTLFRIPGFRGIIERIYTFQDKGLETEFLGFTFRNPVGLAAGFDKNAEVYSELHAFGFSFVEVGTVTPKGQPGNPRPRSFRIPKDKGLINRMGFNNDGAEAAAVKLSRRRPKELILGGNVGKNTRTPNNRAADDYEAVFRIIHDYVDYFVINVSCPNISDLHVLQDQEFLEIILKRILEVRRELQSAKPVLLKISPDLNNKQLDETIDLVSRLKLDGIVATNTTITRNNLKTKERKLDSIGEGGMSGAPITERSLEIVRYISNRTQGKLPIIAAGGIMTVSDALNMLGAGATLIQIYTGFIYNGPAFVKRINKAILRMKNQYPEREAQ